MIGSTISHYNIVEKLGEGGMGVVYKAQDLTLDRLVALKFLPPHVSSSGEDKSRFLQEAKAAAALSHPNICTIYGVEEFTDADASADKREARMFIAMEYVEGQTLEASKANIPLKRAIDIGIQLADGLSAAHEKGVVHRDIKPDNIIIRKDGRVQIMDFGLAKLKGASRLTKEGTTVGTAGYMSPEQVQGQETDHRTDIFSLGVILYELFAGESPFKGVHETAISYEIVNVDPSPISSVRPDVDPELDAIVLECLAKEPSERYQSVGEVAKNLRRFKRESSRSRLSHTMTTRQFEKPTAGLAVERPEPDRSYRKFIWPAATTALAVAFAVLLWRPWGKDTVSRPIMRFSIDLPSHAPLVGGNSNGIALSSDGRYLAYTGLAGNSTQIFVRRLDQLDVQPIPGTDGAVYLCFSPDGQWIAYEANGVIKKVPVSGGASEKVCDIQGQSRGITWTSDNVLWFGHIHGGIFRVSADGGKPEPVTKLDSSAHEISHRFPQILPDGKTVIFTVKQDNITSFDDALIVAERIGTGKRTILVRGGSCGQYVPPGYLVFARGDMITAVSFDPTSLEVKGAPVAIEAGGWLNRGSGDAVMAFSSTGALVFAPAGPLDFENVVEVWLDRHGKQQPLLDSARAYASASVSPDGQKVALTIQAANDDVWLYQIGHGTLTRLTFAGGNHGSPIWSPDGKYIVYFAEKGSSLDIFRKAWDGSGSEERLTSGLNVSALTSFTPDGKALAFAQNGDIWILPLEGDRKPFPFLHTGANERGGQFSPDGRWMAYSSNESGRDEIYVVPYPKESGKWQISTGGGIAPLWSQNGKELFYVNGSKVMMVGITGTSTFDFSTPRPLFDLPPGAIIEDVAPDGQRFAAAVSLAQQITQPRLTVVLECFQELKEKFAGAKN
jgi:serine/threonine protein kinase/Tol biopolymer transport system component